LLDSLLQERFGDSRFNRHDSDFGELVVNIAFHKVNQLVPSGTGRFSGEW